MAIVHMDGFDTYTAVADLLLRYPGSSANMTLSTTGGRFAGGCVFPNTLLKVNIPHSGSNAVIVGGTFNFSSTTSNYVVIELNNNTTSTETTELTVCYDNGIIRLYRSNQTTLLASSTQVYPHSIWHHVEVKTTIADSGGNCEVRVNGVSIINYTGDTRASTTGTAGIDRVVYRGVSSATGGFDDIYILDPSGTFANTFLGDCRVSTLLPSSDSSVQFTRNSGSTNYSCIDEGRQNGDTDYVESGTVGHKDVYGYGDLSASVATVHGVQALSWMRKTDAANRTVRSLVVSGGVTTNGSTVGLNTSYTPIPAIIAADPATGAQWTASGVNSATGGFEIVS